MTSETAVPHSASYYVDMTKGNAVLHDKTFNRRNTDIDGARHQARQVQGPSSSFNLQFTRRFSLASSSDLKAPL